MVYLAEFRRPKGAKDKKPRDPRDDKGVPRKKKKISKAQYNRNRRRATTGAAIYGTLAASYPLALGYEIYATERRRKQRQKDWDDYQRNSKEYWDNFRKQWSGGYGGYGGGNYRGKTKSAMKGGERLVIRKKLLKQNEDLTKAMDKVKSIIRHAKEADLQGQKGFYKKALAKHQRKVRDLIKKTGYKAVFTKFLNDISQANFARPKGAKDKKKRKKRNTLRNVGVGLGLTSGGLLIGSSLGGAKTLKTYNKLLGENANKVSKLSEGLKLLKPSDRAKVLKMARGSKVLGGAGLAAGLLSAGTLIANNRANSKR